MKKRVKQIPADTSGLTDNQVVSLTQAACAVEIGKLKSSRSEMILAIVQINTVALPLYFRTLKADSKKLGERWIPSRLLASITGLSHEACNTLAKEAGKKGKAFVRPKAINPLTKAEAVEILAGLTKENVVELWEHVNKVQKIALTKILVSFARALAEKVKKKAV